MPNLQLADFQRDFAQVLRGAQAGSHWVNNPRIRLYRDLVQRNLWQFINACFPLCQQLMKPAAWRKLCRGFLREHACQSPLFHQIPLEFLTWLQCPQRRRLAAEPAFFVHLAHYEYLELQLSCAPDQPVYSVNAPESLVLTCPIALACYPYAVHTITPETTHMPLQTTWLLLWRTPAGEVRFAQLNAAVYGLLQRLQSFPAQSLASLFECWSASTETPQDMTAFSQAVAGLLALDIVALR